MLPFTETSREDLTLLSPVLAALYAGTGPRTLSRDLNRLRKAGLVTRNGRYWRANTEIMFTFMLPIAAT